MKGVSASLKKPWHGKKPQAWATPQWLVDECALRFAGDKVFELDAAADPSNAKAFTFIEESENALGRSWKLDDLGHDRGATVWLNPPYSNISPWVYKAHAEVESGNVRLVCMLLPVRAEQAWFEFAQRHAWHIEYIDGRVAFDPPPGVEPRQPFEASMIVVFQKRICARR